MRTIVRQIIGPCVLLLSPLWLLISCLPTRAQDDVDAPPEFLPGLICTIQSDGRTVSRVDPDVLFNWQNQAIDLRLPPDAPCTLRWTGFLQSKENGDFQFHVHVGGKVKLRIDGQEILEASYPQPKWVSSKALTLSFGRHPIEIEYTSTNDAARRLGVYWSGPQFELEPLVERHLSHPAEQTLTDQFAVGAQLNRALRCQSCHAGSDGRDPLPAPALTHLEDNLRSEWLIDRLMSQPDLTTLDDSGETLTSSLKDGQRMPHFGLSRADAEALAVTLVAYSAKSIAPKAYVKPKAAKPKKDEPLARVDPSPEAGRTAFLTLGCLACHQLGELGSEKLFDGGDLSNIATKRTEKFLARWLENPAQVNSDHRMPIYKLSPLEQADLTLFLQNLRGQPAADEVSTGSTNQAPDNQFAHGRRLIEKLQCAACHKLPIALQSRRDRMPINAGSDWTQACLTSPDAAQNRPGFGLSSGERESLRVFWTTADPQSLAKLDGRQVLLEQNCVNCHARDGDTGLAPTLAQLSLNHPELAPRLAALAPPALSGVGDKLHDSTLADVLAGKETPRRPWLEVRMPKFRLSDEESAALIKHLIDHDRIPDLQRSAPKIAEGREAELAAARLVTPEGFGCQSCHQIGNTPPPKVAINAHGTDLTMLGERIRPTWFYRWVHNPARIVPRMEMPAIQVAVKGVLQDDLDLQLASLWQTLNTRGFEPPKPNPVRVVRNFNVDNLPEHANVLTDVLETPKKNYLRPLIVGLPNRHNVLFDLEVGRIASWWLGDTARQYTRGKSWFWEAGSQPIVPQADFLEQISIADNQSRIWKPAAAEQFAVQFDRLKHIEHGIEWSGRMEMHSEQESRFVPIKQRIESENTASFSVTTTIENLAATDKILISVPEATQLTLDGQKAQAIFNEYASATWTSNASLQKADDQQLMLSRDESSESGQISWKTRFISRLPADRFQPIVLPKADIPSRAIDCVPGFSGIQLPLPRNEMPTALAWNARGELYFASLKGRVLRARDTDEDGLEDTLDTLSDDLPAPYGLAVNGDSVDVLCKTSLIRLQPDQSAPMLAPYSQRVVADGWGYTADYHDWAVGLSRDPDGSYYMALPCQQDDRIAAAAKLRGTVLKLVPYTSPDSPRAFRLETISAGLRFPMGLAINRGGDLFASDNQGNYNPFNELNHIQFGKRYGFINKLEVQPGFSPPFESPAINMPHPWTRSVNGICFLETPAGLSTSSLFGPFEGDLIGCEYNGLSLIRMSLQKVGDQMQGAAYAFSRPVATGDATFEGPICAAIAPNGDLYIGNLHDSGWGGGQNTGSIVRLRSNGELPLGIDEVRATATGFEIAFTQPVDATKGIQPSNYSLRSYRRISTPAYGGDDQDERNETVRELRLSPDRKLVQFSVDDVRAGCVYEFNIGAIGMDDKALFPSQAHYHLRVVPNR